MSKVQITKKQDGTYRFEIDGHELKGVVDFHVQHAYGKGMQITLTFYADCELTEETDALYSK